MSLTLLHGDALAMLRSLPGAGTTGLVALSLGRSYVGIDLNAGYLALTRKRLAEVEVELFKEGGAS